jgi:hypothetical protein
MFAWYDRHDLVGNALTLHSVLGREPRSLEGYIRELTAGLEARPQTLVAAARGDT